MKCLVSTVAKELVQTPVDLYFVFFWWRGQVIIAIIGRQSAVVHWSQISVPKTRQVLCFNLMNLTIIFLLFFTASRKVVKQRGFSLMARLFRSPFESIVKYFLRCLAMHLKHNGPFRNDSANRRFGQGVAWQEFRCFGPPGDGSTSTRANGNWAAAKRVDDGQWQREKCWTKCHGNYWKLLCLWLPIRSHLWKHSQKFCDEYASDSYLSYPRLTFSKLNWNLNCRQKLDRTLLQYSP